MEIPRDPAGFVGWLSSRHAWVETLRQEHVADYDDLLPHALFGDVTRAASDLANRASTDETARTELQSLLADLEGALTSNHDKPSQDYVDNLIGASFVENAAPPPPELSKLWDALRAYPRLARSQSHFE